MNYLITLCKYEPLDQSSLGIVERSGGQIEPLNSVCDNYFISFDSLISANLFNPQALIFLFYVNNNISLAVKAIPCIIYSDISIRHPSSILLLWITDRNKLGKGKILRKQTTFMKQWEKKRKRS